MIKIENYDVFNFKNAIRGMRNPLNSWDKSDSGYNCVQNPKLLCEPHCTIDNYCNRQNSKFIIGDNDLDLMRRLIKSGVEHRKFMRQIFVSADITAPLYWWKEATTYRAGVTINSCSTMHTIHKKEFELDDFSHEHLFNVDKMNTIIEWLNDYRNIYINWDNEKPFYRNDNGEIVTKKDIWWQLIQLLPSSYNQKRTWTGNYENLLSIYHQRKDHKLDEWHKFCEWIESLPYAKELIIGETNG